MSRNTTQTEPPTTQEILNNPELADALNTAVQKLSIATEEVGQIMVHGKIMEGAVEGGVLLFIGGITLAGTYGGWRIGKKWVEENEIDEEDKYGTAAISGLLSLIIGALAGEAIKSSLMKLLAPRYMVIQQEILQRLSGG